jgi:hypothetical protein
MGRRVRAYKIPKKYQLTVIGIAALSLAIVFVIVMSLIACRINPLMHIIESSGIAVEVDGKKIQPGSEYDLGRVKPGDEYSATFTIQNSGNLDLKLTGSPLVSIIADPSTASMFSISPTPSNTIQARGSSDFTLIYNPLGVDVERTIQLLIMNNSQDEDFTFDLTSFVDGTAPTTKQTTGVPQIYPANNADNISTNVTVSVTFSEAINPDTVTATSFTLTEDPDGAATAIAAVVSYDSSSDTAFLSPLSLLADTTKYEAVVSNTIADLAGNTMVLDYSWEFTTGLGIIDSQPPVVTGTVPADLATGVAQNSTISATFNEPIDPATATTANFIVVSSSSVIGTVGYDNPTRTITFTPDASLDSLTTYTAQLTTGIKDVAGNPLASHYSWSFTTEQGVDLTGPTVVARSPAAGSSGVATNIVVTAEFDELLDPLTVDTNTVKLTQLTGSTGPVSGSITYNSYSKTVTFIPDSTLDGGEQYRATLTTGIEDIVGNAMASEELWLFSTGAAPDNTAPTVVSTNPSDGGTGALLYGSITATFGESMDPSTITNTTFKLLEGTSEIAGTVSYSESTKTATFDPTPLLDETTIYTAKIIGGSGGAKDSAGNPLAADEIWKFTTEAGSTNPIVVEGTLNPTKNAVDVDVDITGIEVEFSKMMNLATIDATTFLLSEYGTGTPVAATSITYDQATRTATFTLGSSLSYSKVYEVECTSDMEDIGGNHLISFSYTFTTVPDNLWDSMKWNVGKWAP